MSSSLPVLHGSRVLLKDTLRYHPAFRTALAFAIYLRGFFRSPADANSVAAQTGHYFRGARIADRPALQHRLEEKARETFAHFTTERFDWERFFPFAGPRLIEKSILLKLPRAGGERGVLFISFEENWVRLFRYANIAALANDYDLVLSPTWSPPHDLAMQIASHLWPRRLYSILSNMEDEAIFRRLYPNIVPVPLLASHWVNPDFFAPRNVAKEFDIAMLANFAQYKRHFALFRALRDARRLKVVLLGRKWEGRTADVLLQEADELGVRDQITIREGLDDEAMIRTLQSAKVSVIMSMTEGSCVAVAEALFADVPVGLIRDARVGSRCFINPATGRFLDASHLGAELERFVADAASFAPRRWMLENRHGYRDSSQALNKLLRQRAHEEELPWTADLVDMQWRPNPEYLSASAAAEFRPAYADFEGRYGIGLRPPSFRP
jgi:Glycosyl transferases group 1